MNTPDVMLLFYTPEFHRVCPQWDRNRGVPQVGDVVGEWCVSAVHRRGLGLMGREVLHVWLFPSVVEQVQV